MKSKFRTLEIAKDFYRDCSKIKLKGVMRNQFERASLSVVLNISEGSARPTLKDRRRFYAIAYGSLQESRTLLELSNIDRLNAKADCLAAHLWKLQQNPGGT